MPRAVSQEMPIGGESHIVPSKIVRVLRSLWRFTYRVFRRSIYGLLIIFVRATDLYSNYLREQVPDSLVRLTDSLFTVIDKFSLWIGVAILVSAVYYTWWEIDKETREPKITKRLKDFYRELDELRTRTITSQADVERLRADLKECEGRGFNWIKQNMQPITLTRLNQEDESIWRRFTVERQDAFNKDHSELLNSIIAKQNRLLVLIEQPVWV